MKKEKKDESPKGFKKKREKKREEKIKFFIMESPLGMIKIKEEDGGIIGLDFVEEGKLDPQTELQKEAEKELEQYFAQERKSFNLPLKIQGSEFQKKVWNQVLEIPYGETSTYGDVARKIDRPKAFRAIGGANSKNPIPILVPCHRVIASNGKISGYSGGVEKKAFLLQLEKGSTLKNKR